MPSIYSCRPGRRRPFDLEVLAQRAGPRRAPSQSFENREPRAHMAASRFSAPIFGSGRASLRREWDPSAAVRNQRQPRAVQSGSRERNARARLEPGSAPHDSPTPARVDQKNHYSRPTDAANCPMVYPVYTDQHPYRASVVTLRSDHLLVLGLALLPFSLDQFHCQPEGDRHGAGKGWFAGIAADLSPRPKTGSTGRTSCANF